MNGFSDLGKDSLKPAENLDLDINLNNPILGHLMTYVKALLNHAVDLSFLQSIKLKNGIVYFFTTHESQGTLVIVGWNDQVVVTLP